MILPKNKEPPRCWYCHEPIMEENAIAIKGENPCWLHWECFFLVRRELEEETAHDSAQE